MLEDSPYLGEHAQAVGHGGGVGQRAPDPLGAQPDLQPAAATSSVNLLHPPLPLAGVSIAMDRGCQQK